MICPYCGSDNTKVNDSRQYPDYRLRRYQCNNCKERFTTKEGVVARKFSNADRFREKTDEELAEFMARFVTPLEYPKEVWDATDIGERCKDAWLKWLRLPAKE